MHQLFVPERQTVSSASVGDQDSLGTLMKTPNSFGVLPAYKISPIKTYLVVMRCLGGGRARDSHCAKSLPRMGSQAPVAVKQSSKKSEGLASCCISGHGVNMVNETLVLHGSE